MNYHKPELLLALAAEYVLGTMSARVRRRFERVMAQDALARADVATWQARLQPMVDRLAPVEPSARVWRRIEQRITHTPGEARPGAAAPKLGAARLVSVWWRRIAIGATTLASVMLTVLLVNTPMAPGTNSTGPAAGWGGPKSWDTWAVLMSEDKQPQMIVCADSASRKLWVVVSNTQAVAPQASLELWLVPKNGAPRSLGVIPGDGVISKELPASVKEQTADVAAVAVSLEPLGGSPNGKPTKVLYAGGLTRHPRT